MSLPPWLYTVYVVVLITASVVTVSFALYAWRRRATPGGLYFVLLMAAVAEWAAAGGAEFATPDLTNKIIWAKLSYLGAVSVAPAWLLFILSYTRPAHWFSGLRAVWLWIVPVGVLALAATNEWHNLIWPQITPFTSAAGTILIYQHGPGVWLNLAYYYVLLFGGTVLLVRTVLHFPPFYKLRVQVLLVGVTLPWLANTLYLAGLIPLPGLEVTPLAFTFTGLAFTWSIFRFQMPDLVPVARDTLVEHLPDGVIVLDAHNRVVDLNPAAGRLIGRDVTDTIGRPANEVLPKWPQFQGHIRDTMETQTEIQLTSANTPQWLALGISPLYDRRKRLTGRLIVLHDITPHRQAQAQFEQYTRELEAHNLELDAFAHTVAHNLKNPLTGLIGYSAMLEADCNDSDREHLAEGLNAITRSGKKIANIIDELLLLASVRRMQEIKTGPVDMSNVVSEAQKRLTRMIVESRAQIKAPDVWLTVISYRPWIEEVWVNYLSNAIKYGGNPPRIELGFDTPILNSQIQDSHVRFWVRDNGCGLAPAEQRQLFTEFTRLGQNGSDGQGLGLSIVRRIVERLGGQVGVESEVGKGSTFWFTLPKKPA